MEKKKKEQSLAQMERNLHRAAIGIGVVLFSAILKSAATALTNAKIDEFKARKDRNSQYEEAIEVE